MSPSKRKKAKRQTQDDKLAEVLRYVQAHPDGALLCVPKALLDDLEAYDSSTTGKIPKKYENWGVYQFVEEQERVAHELPPTGRRKKPKEVELIYFELNQFGLDWLSEYEAAQIEEKAAVWKDVAKEADGVRRVVLEHSEQSKQTLAQLQEQLVGIEKSLSGDSTGNSEELLQDIRQEMKSAREEALQSLQEKITLLFEEATKELAQGMLEQASEYKQSLQRTSTITREIQGKMEGIRQQAEVLNSIVEDALPERFPNNLEEKQKKSKSKTSSTRSERNTTTSLRGDLASVCELALSLIPNDSWMSLPELAMSL